MYLAVCNIFNSIQWNGVWYYISSQVHFWHQPGWISLCELHGTFCFLRINFKYTLNDIYILTDIYWLSKIFVLYCMICVTNVHMVWHCTAQYGGLFFVPNFNFFLIFFIWFESISIFFSNMKMVCFNCNWV